MGKSFQPLKRLFWTIQGLSEVLYKTGFPPWIKDRREWVLECRTFEGTRRKPNFCQELSYQN